MSSETYERYTRSTSPSNAIDNVSEGDSWNELWAMRASAYHPQTGHEYRITVERIEPEPKKKKWRGKWNSSGLEVKEEFDSIFIVSGTIVEYDYYSSDVVSVSHSIHSATEPTLAEFAAAVKEATGVEIPVPEEEEPQWWYRVRGGKWITPTTTDEVVVDNTRACVFGTTKDRDAKRDALLAAVKAAGPSEGDRE